MKQGEVWPGEHGVGAEGTGTGGTVCHLKASGHLAASGKAQDCFTFTFICQPFITVVTVTDTVRIRVIALQYFGVCLGMPGGSSCLGWLTTQYVLIRGKANLKIQHF